MCITAIYETDPWHSKASQELIACATSDRQVNILVKQYLSKHLSPKPNRETKELAIRQIKEMGQTQCLSEQYDIEIYTETFDTNVILQ